MLGWRWQLGQSRAGMPAMHGCMATGVVDLAAQLAAGAAESLGAAPAKKKGFASPGYPNSPPWQPQCGVVSVSIHTSLRRMNQGVQGGS